jgi:hypothetical protein
MPVFCVRQPAWQAEKKVVPLTHTGANRKSAGQLHPALHSFIKVKGLRVKIVLLFFRIRVG